MSPAPDYCVWYSKAAAAFLLALSPRDQRRLWDHAQRIARYPFLGRGLSVTDSDGRQIQHFVVDRWILIYWVDHTQRSVMLFEIETKD